MRFEQIERSKLIKLQVSEQDGVDGFERNGKANKRK
jgi:hypothetical protein